MPYLLGLDVGSSSVKASLLDAEKNTIVAAAGSPDTELPILAPEPGFAEQDPESWWEHAIKATHKVLAIAGGEAAQDIIAVGISYQMHGLVCLDAAGAVVRPSIIWCDSRAVGIGEAASAALGVDRCREHLLNAGPGNFTASKLRWVQENEPELYSRIATILLPGDYLAYRLTGERTTTASGLSEGMLWDVQSESPAQLVLDHYNMDAALLGRLVPTFSDQGRITEEAAKAFGIPAHIPVAYRAGDQPNNALSLNVLEPGEIAATAGTSGVVYGVSDTPQADPQERVNSFVHVNHTADARRYGVLLCVNGTGIAYSWLRRVLGGGSYDDFNRAAEAVGIGSDDLIVLPFGNGSERSLGNRTPGGAWQNLDFNRHDLGHMIRATQEGIACALAAGISGMQACGVHASTIRAGAANLFLSPLFRQTFADLTGATVELYDTDGAAGAARGAGIGVGHFSDSSDAFSGLSRQAVIEPIAANQAASAELLTTWQASLTHAMARVEH
jgi:xylulokinase